VRGLGGLVIALGIGVAGALMLSRDSTPEQQIMADRGQVSAPSGESTLNSVDSTGPMASLAPPGAEEGPESTADAGSLPSPSAVPTSITSSSSEASDPTTPAPSAPVAPGETVPTSAPPTSDAPPVAGVASSSSACGSVTVRYTSSSIELESVAPSATYAAVVESSEAHQLKVKFEAPESECEITAVLVDGQVHFVVEGGGGDDDDATEGSDDEDEDD